MPRWMTLAFCHLVFWVNDESCARHNGKHIHVMFKNIRGSVFNIETGKIYQPQRGKNSLKPDEISLAQKIIRRHRDQLLIAWDKTQRGELIPPMKLHHQNALRDLDGK